MEELSTKEYNKLYKKYFKEIFNKPMKDFGYKKKGTGRFCKINKIGLFEYIGFFRYYHELRIEYAIIPIYSYIMKNSIGNGSETEFVDLDGEEKMEKGMKSILEEIENKIIPWFKKYEDLDVFLDKVREEYNKLPDEEKAYDFYNVILKEVDELEEKLKEGEESLEKHIKKVEYKSLLAWKMEKLLKK